MIPATPDPTAPPPPDAAKVSRLHEIVDSFGSVAIAFSAGIDSTLVLKVCRDRLGDRAVGVIGVSPSLPPGELEEARGLAGRLDASLVEINTDEFQSESYTANPENRCYFCKTELYRHVVPYARQHDIAVVADGLNVDDQGDWRPGAKAADEAGVRHPLQEAGFTKQDIRGLAHRLELPNWNKPALACLSSRIPYGTPIDAALLGRVGQAERDVLALGFRRIRVRSHDQVARLELPPDELPRAIQRQAEIVAAVKAAGFTYVTLDLEGYRTGSLNQLRRQG